VACLRLSGRSNSKPLADAPGGFDTPAPVHHRKGARQAGTLREHLLATQLIYGRRRHIENPIGERLVH